MNYYLKCGIIWCLIFQFSTVMGQDTVIVETLRPSQDTAILIKNALKEMFQVQDVAAVHSRKSCNCGCDIKKERYSLPNKNEQFETFDFCDSQVFEWSSHSGDCRKILDGIQLILNKTGYKKLNSELKVVHKFKTDRYSIEGPDVLTFIELNQKKDGSIKLKISLATP